MGKISQGILDGISGKVGNVVGANWKGIDYIRIKPDHISNPRTESQVNHRTKFKGVTSLAKKVMGTIIRPIWNPAAIKMTGYNLFVKKNIDAFGIDGSIEDFSKLSFSTGSLSLPEGITVIADDVVDHGIKISWDNILNIGNKDDKLMVIAVNLADEAIVAFFENNVTRADGAADLVLPFESRSDVSVSVFFGNPAKRAYSPSVQITVTI